MDNGTLMTEGRDANALQFGDAPTTGAEFDALIPAAPFKDGQESVAVGEDTPETPVETPTPDVPTPDPVDDIPQSLRDLLSEIDVDLSDTPDPQKAALETIALAAGFGSADALLDHVEKERHAGEVKEILDARKQEMVDLGWDEDEIKAQLAVDKRELDLRALEQKYRGYEQKEKLQATLKKYPYADEEIVREYAESNPKGNLDAFAAKVHERFKLTVQRATSKYAAQKAKDAGVFVPDTRPSGPNAGVTSPPVQSADAPWSDLLGLKKF